MLNANTEGQMEHTEYVVINNAIPGAGCVLGYVWAENSREAEQKAAKAFPRHAANHGVTVMENGGDL